MRTRGAFPLFPTTGREGEARVRGPKAVVGVHRGKPDPETVCGMKPIYATTMLTPAGLGTVVLGNQCASSSPTQII